MELGNKLTPSLRKISAIEYLLQILCNSKGKHIHKLT